MFDLLVSFALLVLPLGASVTLTDSGQCANANRAPLSICTDYQSDMIVIEYHGSYYRGQSAALRQLTDNIK